MSRLTGILFFLVASSAMGSEPRREREPLPSGSRLQKAVRVDHSRRLPREIATPAVFASNLNGTQTVSLNNVVRADRFYVEGYTGTNARVANIEGGTPWRGHETLDWVLASNIFATGSALTEASGSTQNHATAVSQMLVGKAPLSAADPELHRGMAFGVPASQFFAGNIALSFGSGGSFTISNADLRNTYHAAIVTGVHGEPANRVDVVNSSWSGSTTDFNLNIGSKILDAVVFEGNQTRGSTVVFSAGNDGPTPNRIGRPVSGFNTIAVAALGEFASDSLGTLHFNVAASFSDRGPITVEIPATASATTGTNVGAVRARVDLAAPGVHTQLATYNSAAPSSNAYAPISGTSFAAPTVAGGVALLADYAHSALSPTEANAAIDGRVIRAVLINSADKTSGWSNSQTWNGSTWSTTQGLDYTTGGGRMNLDQAFNQFAITPGRPISQLVNPSVNTANSILPTGWVRATLDQPVAADRVNADFAMPSLAKYAEFNTTLNWFVQGTSTDLGTADAIGFHNLDLEVWRADAAGTPTTLAARSTAAYNNVEHLSFLLPEASRYVLRVTRPGGAAGTYYSFPGETTSDVFGLAWNTRPSLLITASTTLSSGATPIEANVLISPDSGNAGSLTISGSGTRLDVLNRALVGGTDYGPGDAGSLTIASSAKLSVSNRLRVFNGSTLNLQGGTLEGGTLTLDTGAALQLSGASILQLSRIETETPITVLNGASATIRSFIDFENDNSGRLHLGSAAAAFEVTGGLTVQSLITGSNGLTKNGPGTLSLQPIGTGQSNLYIGTTHVNAGTLRLLAAGGIPSNNAIIVSSGATFDIQSVSNTRAASVGSMTLDGGTFRVPIGSGVYYLKSLIFQGGSANFTGTTDFQLRFPVAGNAIASLASSTTATWTSSGTSAVYNDHTAPVNIAIAAGTTANGIDLDADVIFSSLGASGGFYKTGSGTLRLTNPGNSANFDIQAGRLRADDMAALGAGIISLSGGTLAYTGGTASSMKALTIATLGGAFEVSNPGTTLTLNGNTQIFFGSNSFAKTGPGTLVLAGSNTGTASAISNIVAGKLRVTANDALPFGSTVTVHATASLELASHPTAAINILSGGTLLGNGGLASGSSLALHGRIAPGADLGLRGNLSIQGDLLFHAGGNYTWDINAIPTGAPGTDWDTLTSTGTLGGTATPSTPFTLTLHAVGTVSGFDRTQSYTWTIATFANGILLTPADFALDPQGWTGPNDITGGNFTAIMDANSLQVHYAPVPEPGFGLAVGVLVLLGRRLRNS